MKVSVLEEFVDCKHIFSYQEGVDEAWLNYTPLLLDPDDPFDVVFNFCPLCGEELILKF
jgi:hypothetical protein